MDQRERYQDKAESIRVALEALQTRLWTAIPCKVVNFPAQSGLSQMMLDAQPCIAGSVLNEQGSFDTLQMPLLVDLPIYFPGGGGCTLTFPIKAGDECLVIFASRCIDAWWQQGSEDEAVTPPNARMHSLSDGFAFVGVRSLANEFIVNPELAMLRSDDAEAVISMDPIGHNINVETSDGDVTVIADAGDVTFTAGGTITGTAPTINLNGVTIDADGNISTPGTIDSDSTITAAVDVVANDISLATHVHTSASPGSPTSPPLP